MSSIFISYRRRDVGGHARHLHNRLLQHFESKQVFYDNSSLDTGTTFPEALTAAVNAATVTLVLIGDDWLNEINRRVDLPDLDYVLAEVSLSLQRSQTGDLILIPVLLDSATMPASTQLHPTLQTILDPLLKTHAHSFTSGATSDWEHQLTELVNRLKQLFGTDTAPTWPALPLDLIEFLADHYPDVPAARSLWERAGGKGREVENNPRPLDLWQALWKKSVAGAHAQPGLVLREAFKDYPGNPVIKKHLTTD